MEQIRRMQSLERAEQRRVGKASLQLRGLGAWISGGLRRLHSSHPPMMKQMHLVETLPLGGKRQLMLVSCAGESFLVGGGLDSVETIVRVQGEVSPAITARNLDESCI